MDLKTMSPEALSAALTEKQASLKTLFALEQPTVDQVDEIEALMASAAEIEAEQSEREATLTAAADRFAAAKAKFSSETEEKAKKDEKPFAEETIEAGLDDEPEVDEEPETEPEGDEPEAEPEGDADAEGEGDAAVTASAVRGQRIPKRSVAKTVAKGNARPVVKAAPPVTITAAADIPRVAMGSNLDDMEAVAKALTSRVKNFGQFNLREAEGLRDQGITEKINKASLASISIPFDAAVTAAAHKSDNDYSPVKAALSRHRDVIKASMGGEVADGVTASLTAAGWCAPSENVYTYIADYVVDGLLTVPETSAPRGGLNITQGPQLAQTTFAGDAGRDSFGFGGTEAQAEAGYTKTCETIECPEFEDYRLDFSGYCWKIPLLTEHAYPELVADALRLSNVLYAHKMNARFINDIVGYSDQVDATGLGGILTDTLEALTQVAIKERRWWNLGENATMEVKLPQIARDIFKFDMSRRSGLALSDIATDQKIAAHFANHNLAVEYVADWQDDNDGLFTDPLAWPAQIRALIYPVGSYVKAVEDVINMSAIYDSASLTQNEYTGVFFEQGVKMIPMGYRSHEVTIDVCAAGRTGALDLTCVGSI